MTAPLKIATRDLTFEFTSHTVNASSFDRPSRLGQVLTGLIRKKGLAEQSSGRELDRIWKQLSGTRVAAKSHVRRLHRGVLEIGVSNGAILEELIGYLQQDLLEQIQKQHPDHKVQSLKFIRVR